MTERENEKEKEEKKSREFAMIDHEVGKSEVLVLSNGVAGASCQVSPNTLGIQSACKPSFLLRLYKLSEASAFSSVLSPRG